MYLLFFRNDQLKCNLCEYVGNKRSAIWHVIKEHAESEEVPFSCSLCKFRAPSMKKLKSHVKGYKPHLLLKEGMVQEDEDYFRISNRPKCVTWGTGGKEDLTIILKCVKEEKITVQEQKVEVKKQSECVREERVEERAMDVCDDESKFIPDYEECEEDEEEKVTGQEQKLEEKERMLKVLALEVEELQKELKAMKKKSERELTWRH